MGYVELETANAKYRLEFISHFQSPSDIVPADAIVFETGLANPENIYNLEEDLSMGACLKFARENGIDIFLPDAEPKLSRIGTSLLKYLGKSAPITLAVNVILEKLIIKSKLPRRKFLGLLSTLISFAAAPIFWSNLFVRSGEIKKESTRQFIAYFESVLPSVILELRNTLVAEKLEEFVALELRKKLKRKPLIYATFGSGHVGLVEALKDATYRKQVLQSFYPLSDYLEERNLYDCFRMKWDPASGKWIKKVEKGILKETPPTKAFIEQAKKELQILVEKEKREIKFKDAKPKIAEREKRFDRRELFRRLKPKA